MWVCQRCCLSLVVVVCTTEAKYRNGQCAENELPQHDHPSYMLLQTQESHTKHVILDAEATTRCSSPWGQCGGTSWDGAQCCTAGHKCVVQDSSYSQCKPVEVPSDDECARPWDQCGGMNWNGPLCCSDGYSCVAQSEWYSQFMQQKNQAPMPESDATAQETESTTPPPLATHPPATMPPSVPAASTTSATLPHSAPLSAGTSPKFVGELTMWATQDSLMGAQCEYANAPVGDINDPVLPSYLRKGFHCAIGDSNPGFGNGEHCGKCYRLTSLHDSGKYGTPGTKSSAVVMVSNGGAGGPAHFDCILESFQAITGASTGVFEIEFEETLCEDVHGGPVVINWADQNAYYCKMMFENIGHWGQLESVEACLNGEVCATMKRFAGATWTGCPVGEGSSMVFKLSQRSPSGEDFKITCDCKGAWPWPTGERCVCPTNFAEALTA